MTEKLVTREAQIENKWRRTHGVSVIASGPTTVSLRGLCSDPRKILLGRHYII
jgi:hypothetical protein